MSFPLGTRQTATAIKILRRRRRVFVSANDRSDGSCTGSAAVREENGRRFVPPASLKRDCGRDVSDPHLRPRTRPRAVPERVAHVPTAGIIRGVHASMIAALNGADISLVILADNAVSFRSRSVAIAAVFRRRSTRNLAS